MPVTARRRLLPAAALTAAATVALALPLPGTASAADPAAAAKAAGYLADQLSDAGTVVGSYPGPDGRPVLYTDYGRTIDAALGLLAAGGQDDTLGTSITSLTDRAALGQYTQGAPGDRADAAYVGATAKLAFLVEAAGGDATSVSGVNLIDQLLSLATPEGRMADRSSYGSYANLYGHAFTLLALDSADRPPAPALVQGLLDVQCADGSFPENYEPKAPQPCTGQVDATGLVLQALAAVAQETSDAAQRAASWLSGQQKADGSFPGEAPVNSTGYAVAGLLAVGAGTGSADTYLAVQQNTDGGLGRGAGTGTGSDLFATAQALPALAGKTFQGAARSVDRRPVPCGNGAGTSLSRSTITAGEIPTVKITAASGSTVDLYAYSRPSTTYRKVRSGLVGSTGAVTFTVRPYTNTRMYAQQRGCDAGPSVVLNVRSRHWLSVVRNGTRDYTFSGKIVPARAGGMVVNLYRITSDGKYVLTAQTRANATTGAWTIRRKFTGTGRFGFRTRSAQDLINAPGASPVRSVLIS